jgi:DNA invertase Pin-like site-specific DNA recombinase
MTKPNAENPQPRAIAYYRVSTAKQGRSGLGLEAQEAAVAAYVASSGSKLLAPPYVEIESGKNNERPKLAAAIAHAKRTRAVLVIAKLDRLARNVHFVSGLMESGVDFVACDNPHATRLTVHILAAVAEAEARAISDRTKAALAAAKARGTKLGTNNLTAAGTLKGSAAGVASIKRAKAEAYESIAPIVAGYAEQGLSLRAIAARLNDQGETTRSGRLWNAMQVSRVLKSVAAA